MNIVAAKDLHKKFVQLGMMRHKLMNEMLSILPEIYQSGIYKKYASSIFEYASKFGGISESAVRKRLRLEKYLMDKPTLREAIREVGVNKVSLVATIATKETEKAFADKVRYMSKSAISTLSKELRRNGGGEVGLFDAGTMDIKSDEAQARQIGADAGGQLRFCEDGFQDSSGGCGLSRCAAVPVKIKIELDEEQSFLFLKLREKWGKHLSNKEVMKKMLEKMMEVVTGDGLAARGDKTMTGHANRKFDGVVIGNGFPQTELITGDDSVKTKEAPGIDVSGHSITVKRYIPAAQKRKILQESHGRCSYPGCNRPAQIFHHVNRFMENKNHDSIQALCRDHHEFPHNGLIAHEGDKPTEWKIDINGEIKHHADVLYRTYRTQAIHPLS